MHEHEAAVDTNVALRYLQGDDPEHSPPAVRLIREAPKGSLYVSAVVVAEVVWIMQKKYLREQVASALQRFLANESISADPIIAEAVVNYSRTNLDFADCLLAAWADAFRLPLISYDRDYRKFKDIKVLTPVEWLAAR